MIKVGLTGGIGSGKTTIARFFERQFNIPVFYSDIEAKIIMNENDIARQGLIHLIGEEVFDTGGNLNKNKVADFIFNSPNSEYNIQLINDLIHPLVENAFDLFCQEHQDTVYVLKESAILFETGLYKHLDYNILVSCTHQEQKDRVMQRDQLNADEVQAKINKQWTEKEKRSLTDYIIYNSNNQFIIPQINHIHQFLTQKSENA